MIIIGSSCVVYNSGYMNRPISDLDVICTNDEFKTFVKEIIKVNPEARLLELGSRDKGKRHVIFDNAGQKMIVEADILDDEGNKFFETNNVIYEYRNNICTHRYITLFGVSQFVWVSKTILYYILKHSHKYLKNSPHFKKTMDDIIHLEETAGMNFDEIMNSHFFKKFYDMRVKETYNYSHPKLNTTKDQFFTDSVPYKYDHDTIHEAVKHLDKPAYQYYMQEGAQVNCSKEAFDNLPEIVKLYGVLEESYVLALERAIIPFNADPKKAFDTALMKVCTSITSGWFREYAWKNYYKVQEMYHASFVNKFTQALEAGKIQPFNGSMYGN